MKGVFGALACLLLTSGAIAAKLVNGRVDPAMKLSLAAKNESQESWCPGNKWPSGYATINAQGVHSGLSIINSSATQALRDSIKDDVNWVLKVSIWEFKARVESTSPKMLRFGFRDSQTGYLTFSASENTDVVSVEGVVGSGGSEVELVYLSAEPNVLSDEKLTFTDVCLRPMLCSGYKGCLPTSLYSRKTSGTGISRDQCCDPIMCSDAVPAENWAGTCVKSEACQDDEAGAAQLGTELDLDARNCSAMAKYCNDDEMGSSVREHCCATCEGDTGWVQPADFASRLGKRYQDCCEPAPCSENTCSSGEGMSTKYKLKVGTGRLGKTVEECCDPIYCARFQDICNGSAQPRSTTLEDGSPRLGSTVEECCDVPLCQDVNCSLGGGMWTFKADVSGVGSSFHECCEPLYCGNWSCDNKTKYRNFTDADPSRQGSDDDKCCASQECMDYTCQDNTTTLRDNYRKFKGSTDEECCEKKMCSKYECSVPTKWVKKPPVEDDGNGTLMVRHGATDEECCDNLSCRNYPCDSTKWKSKNYTAALGNDTDPLGSTHEECCEPVWCSESWTCFETKYFHKTDTHSHRYQGASNEECCYPKFCSQYTTTDANRWKRKVENPNDPLLGSTDVECYDERWCSTWLANNSCPSGTIHTPMPNETQGSNETDCCV
eukprot:TRINITY_DN51769_c0_g1_i1.p1 TRINITY_DN51769_c0_g1~~TRINITY_DN51769_c0_g1_i1.p1  ORF type:complete len:662 (+),score=103.02 TRINITY_DN51769_c0_g1_i1:90-2075(+)